VEEVITSIAAGLY